MKYIIANWKANKNIAEVNEWLEGFGTQLKNNETLLNKLNQKELALIICPPFPFLTSIKPLEHLATSIYIGAQTLSSFEEGAYTGEVTAKSLKDIVSYAILGHSERRTHFQETDEMLAKKVAHAQAENIEPILCIRGTQDAVIPHVKYIAYEPVEAIGTGKNMPVEEVVEKKKTWNLAPETVFIYGGSVNESTALSYLSNPEIHGLLIGGASLKPESFLAIAQLA